MGYYYRFNAKLAKKIYFFERVGDNQSFTKSLSLSQVSTPNSSGQYTFMSQRFDIEEIRILIWNMILDYVIKKGNVMIFKGSTSRWNHVSLNYRLSTN